MAKETTEERLRKLEIEVAEGRGRRSVWLAVLSVATTVAIGVSSWAFLDSRGEIKEVRGEVSGVSKDVSALRADVAGISALVTKQLPKLALESVGKDPIQAAKVYSASAELLSGLGRAHTKIDVPEANSLALTLSAQAPQHASLPEFWTLASQLIDAKAVPIDGSIDISGDCLTGPTPLPLPVNHPEKAITEQLQLLNCTLRLDDPNYAKSWIAHLVEMDKRRAVGAETHYLLNNVRVIYRGGHLIPITTMQFVHCYFDFQLDGAPSQAPARSLGLQLLAADYSKGDFLIRLPEQG